MLENIYIARHGFRSNWVDKTITTGPTMMERDPPLAGYGLEQSNDLATFLANPPSPLLVPELIFSSPFYRCIQTAAPLSKRLGLDIKLEHGVQEWYSNVIPDTGLHPRPGHAEDLQHFFPEIELNKEWKSTVYASRRGEDLKALLARAEVFVDAFVRRVEAEFPDVKTIVIYSHAASVIALGRALTGNPTMDIIAGCATTSLYTRRRPTTPPQDGSSPAGEFDCQWHGRADYLPNGVERNWGYRDIVLDDTGEVIHDKGNLRPHTAQDELPIGLVPEYTKYLTRADPYTSKALELVPQQVRDLLDSSSNSGLLSRL